MGWKSEWPFPEDSPSQPREKHNKGFRKTVPGKGEEGSAKEKEPGERCAQKRRRGGCKLNPSAPRSASTEERRWPHRRGGFGNKMTFGFSSFSAVAASSQAADDGGGQLGEGASRCGALVGKCDREKTKQAEGSDAGFCVFQEMGVGRPRGCQRHGAGVGAGGGPGAVSPGVGRGGDGTAGLSVPTRPPGSAGASPGLPLPSGCTDAG